MASFLKSLARNETTNLVKSTIKDAAKDVTNQAAAQVAMAAADQGNKLANQATLAAVNTINQAGNAASAGINKANNAMSDGINKAITQANSALDQVPAITAPPAGTTAESVKLPNAKVIQNCTCTCPNTQTGGSKTKAKKSTKKGKVNNDLTVVQLRKIANELQIIGRSKMNKAALIRAINKQTLEK